MNHDLTNPSASRVSQGDPLFEINEEAYRVFAYPKPKSTGVCEQCCMASRIEKDFFNPAISDLSLKYVRDIAAKMQRAFAIRGKT